MLRFQRLKDGPGQSRCLTPILGSAGRKSADCHLVLELIHCSWMQLGWRCVGGKISASALPGAHLAVIPIRFHVSSQHGVPGNFTSMLAGNSLVVLGRPSIWRRNMWFAQPPKTKTGEWLKRTQSAGAMSFGFAAISPQQSRNKGFPGSLPCPKETNKHGCPLGFPPTP